MAIQILDYHGRLPETLSKKMDKIAMPIVPSKEWEFEGSVGDFAEQWGEKFLCYQNKGDGVKTIFVTQYNSFSAR